MNARLFCPVQSAIAHHIHGETLAAAALQLDLPPAKSEWSEADSCEATMAMAAQVLSLVNAMPDGPARRQTVRLLESARQSYAQAATREAA
ncbi:hypothetical protein B0T37_10700 [Chromobacterium violaceum]|uniref:hypothetical protein n=1 Tax=Chromobacterium violaceum TaxID=536 RepID=UPI0009DA442C|nr:hypothetical protein [Chromobacterium violaceum]OQS10107.1 hypothetical protein B0T38_11095 [Chromobacterium violaceum]OQS26522.1 hypothetical protein B0T37_10700 [Chromobacterium violaceum]